MLTNLSTMVGKGRVLLVSVFACVLGFVPMSAETIFEDFESLTLTDADGNAVSSSFSFGTGLSNGWKIIGGSIYGSEGTTNYGLVKNTGKGWNDSDCYLEASYGSTNSAYVFIPQQLQGSITFYAKCSSTKSQGTVKVFEADANGNVSATLMGEFKPVPGGTWMSCTIEGVKGKYIAINMVRAWLDDFSAEVGDGSSVAEEQKKALAITAFTLATETSYASPIAAGEGNMFTADFTVTVKNSGNVDLNADEVRVQIEDADKNVAGTATATTPLAVGEETTLTVSISASAGELGSTSVNILTYYASEAVGGTRYSGSSYVYVTPYAPKFAINGPDGWRLDEGETVNFGTTNTAVTRTLAIRNEGTAPLTVSSITLPEGFSTEQTAFDVAAGTTETVTLTLTPEAPYGQKGGTAVITHALGTFTFDVSGTTVDPEKYFVNFEDQQFPASWTVGEKWAISSQSGNYFARQSSTTGATAIVTQKLTAAENETLTFQAKRAYSSTAATIAVSYSADKETWTAAATFNLTSAFNTCTVAGIPAGDCYLKFEGQYVDIDNIAGFKEATDAPLLGVYLEGTQLEDGMAISFGLASGDTTITVTVKNDGTGTLNAAVATDGDDFTADKESVELQAGESTDLTVTMTAQPWGIKTGTLTIGDLTIDLYGESRDPEMLFVDFEDGQWPEGWLKEGKWSIYNNMAEHYDYDETAEPGTLRTAKLRVEEGMTLTFDAKRSTETYTSSLSIMYSEDMRSWTVSTKEYELTSEMNNFSVDLPVGDYYVLFMAKNADLDNITGVKLSKQTDHIVAMMCDIPEEGMVNNAYTATAVVENQGTDGEEVTVRFYFGGEAVMEETATMKLGEMKTFTYTFTPQEPREAVEAYFEIAYNGQTEKDDDQVATVTIKAEEGDAITLQGTVTDESNEEPLEGVSITLACGDISYSATTDAQGHYQMTVYKHGAGYKYSLTAELEGYITYTTDTYYVNAFGENNVEENIKLQKNTPTAISLTTATQQRQQGYDLNGRPTTANTGKGIIIIVNGRKVVRK